MSFHFESIEPAVITKLLLLSIYIVQHCYSSNLLADNNNIYPD